MPIGVPKVPYRMPGSTYTDWISIYSRLARERIIFIGEQIDDELANEVIAILLYLDSEDSGKDIIIYLNSPFMSVFANFFIQLI